MTILRASCLLAMLLLCGCAPTTVAPEQMHAIRRVAVISAIGDKFTVKKIGITVFGNDEKDFAIDAWGIDAFVVNKVRSVLAGRFEVRPVAYQPSALAKDATAVNIVESVRAQSAPADIDAYVVVTKDSSPFGTSNQSLSGLGIVQNSGLVGAVNLYALYSMTVVDGHNLSVAARSQAFPVGQMLLSMKSIRGPSRELDESWIPTTLDASQNIRLKNAVVELLDRNLPGTIENLKLTQ